MDPELQPSSEEEVEEIVRAALLDRRTLHLQGAATKTGFGHPVRADHTLHLDRLQGITLYEPEELVLAAKAGTPLARIESVLAENRQELAFEPADYGSLLGAPEARQTIGGVIACNLFGPRRIKAGSARDHLLGIRCVTGRGESLRAGGRVMKNVTGYDLPKLLCGSFGTLAVLTEVTLKVLPAAETVGTLLLHGGSEPDLLAALRKAMGTPFEVSGAALLPELAQSRSEVAAVRAVGAPLALLRVEGPPPSVAYRLDRLAQEIAAPGLQTLQLEDAPSRTLWREIRDLRLLHREHPLWRIAVPPTAADALAIELAERSPERLYDQAGGLIWLAVEELDPEDASRLRSRISAASGQATLVRAPQALRARIPVFHPRTGARRVLERRVKDAFDPMGILNPGRIDPEF